MIFSAVQARKNFGFPRSRAVYAPLRFVLNKRHWRLAPPYQGWHRPIADKQPVCLCHLWHCSL